MTVAADDQVSEFPATPPARAARFMSSIHPQQYESRNGRNVLLRTASPDDAGALIEYARAVLLPSEFFVTQPDEFDLTEEQEREWIEKHRHSPGSLIGLAQVDGAVV